MRTIQEPMESTFCFLVKKLGLILVQFVCRKRFYPQPLPNQAMGNITAAPPTTNISVDVIRTVAIVLVIFLHATADLTVPQMDQFEIIRWTTNDVYQSIGRICVPLFVMLSGALLLRPEKHDTIGSFFKKRWARIGLPWIFWGAAYFAWIFWSCKILSL